MGQATAELLWSWRSRSNDQPPPRAEMPPTDKGSKWVVGNLVGNRRGSTQRLTQNPVTAGQATPGSNPTLSVLNNLKQRSRRSFALK